AEEIADLLGKGTHIVGAVPNFDTERIAILLRRFGFAPGWHHHLIDVEALAVGYLHGIPGERPPFPHERLPWASDTLSRAVGVDPHSATAGIATLRRRFGFAPGWHHHLIDAEALAVGYPPGIPGERPPFPHERLPWASDTLSRAVGVDPDDFDRHTALGDARWARAIYDAITGGPKEES